MYISSFLFTKLEVVYKPKGEAHYPTSLFNLNEINPRTSFSIERSNSTSLFDTESTNIYGTVSAIDR